MESNQEGSVANIYVLVVDSEGDMDILQLTYDTKWEDLAVMLQVKYGHEEAPLFTYTDEDEDYIALDSQEGFDEALKICRKNNDVLHVQMRKPGTAPLVSSKKVEKATKTTQQTPTRLHDDLENARASMSTSLDWASNLVKSAVREIGKNIRSASVNDDAVSLEEDPFANAISADNLESKEQDAPLDQSQLHSVPYLPLESETIVKTVLETPEISVSTSEISDADELTVKLPISSSSKDQRENEKEDNENEKEFVKTIKEEVRKAISHEISALREEITTSFIGNKGVQKDASKGECSRYVPRSPRAIKSEIKELKREMKAAQQLKKQLKAESALSKAAVVKSPTRQSRKYVASFICENLLDGSCVETGQHFVKYWVLKNEGTEAWDHTIQLELLEERPPSDGTPVDPSTSEDGGKIQPAEVDLVKRKWGPEKQSVPLPNVNNSETAVIAVSHFAPSHPCAYTSSWRLSRSGRRFGPRIWCTVNVVTKDNLPSIPSMSYDASESEQDYSHISRKFSCHPPQEVKHNHENQEDDNFTNMLSFEMTAIGDCHKLPPLSPHDDQNFSYLGPSSQEASLKEDRQLDTESMHQTEKVKSLGVKDEEKDEKTEHLADTEVLSDFESMHEIPESLGSEQASPPKEEQEEEEHEEIADDRSSDGEGESSDVNSDFEVIPLPECFDVSRPLHESDEEEGEEEEKIASLTSTTTTLLSVGNSIEGVKPSEDAVVLSSEPQVQAASTSKPSLESQNFNLSNPVNKDEGEQEAPQTSSLEVKPSPVPQSVLELDKPLQLTKQVVQHAPLPVPQSVLDMDKPCDVDDYSHGYTVPKQIVASPEQTWVQTPIPLPRGVLDADKPWTKTEARETSSPSPQPRKSAAQPKPSEQLQSNQPWDAAMTSNAITDPEEPNQDEESPRILYPPERDAEVEAEEEEDEFSLAPEDTTTPRSPTEVFVPPGYPDPQLSVPTDHIQRPATPREQENLSPMEQLIEMGFMDIDLNNDLLGEFQGDVSKVVHALVHRSNDRGMSRNQGGAQMQGGFMV
ncbi:unnamed protein product [Clavelina lepadiformis]|uniref:UBA domain-containing protein n=1 Tax=Clavelina lepadiformis TaxID=159417 RepID=A0ABP0F415_CLALP